MNSTWKNLCPRWNWNSRTQWWLITSAWKRNLSFPSALLHTRKSINSLIQWLSMVWVFPHRPFSYPDHNVLLQIDVLFGSYFPAFQAELKLWLQDINPTLRCSWPVTCIPLILLSREYVCRCFPVCYLIPVDWGHQSNWETKSDQYFSSRSTLKSS